MRSSAIVCALMVACGQVKPAPDAMEPRETATPEVGAVRPDDAADGKAGVALPAAPASAALRPRSVLRTSRVPLAEVKTQSVAIIPGEPGLNLELGQPERAAVTSACKELCSYPPCSCDGIRPHDDYLLIRVAPQSLKTGQYAWFAMKRVESGWTLLTVTDDHPGGTQSTVPDRLCAVAVDTGALPADQGVVRVLRLDLNLDGREDLLLECRDHVGDHHLAYCLSNTQYCEERLRVREVWDDEVAFDADVVFRDGWFVYSVHIDTSDPPRGNVRVDGVKAPEPGTP